MVSGGCSPTRRATSSRRWCARERRLLTRRSGRRRLVRGRPKGARSPMCGGLTEAILRQQRQTRTRMLKMWAGLGRRVRGGWRPGRTTQLVAGLLVALVVLVPGAAKAVGGTILYVDRSNPSCSNSNSGTIDRPFCTIGAAAQVVGAGQTVQVAAGTYSEDVTIGSSGTSSAPIVFTTAPGATVTVTGQDNAFTILAKNWVTINGFNVTRTNNRGIDVSNAS